MKYGKRIGALLMSLMLGVSMMTTVMAAEPADTQNEYRDDELIHPDNKALSGTDIVFVIDNSGSIWKQQEIRDAALRTVADLAVGSDVRIGAVYFADHVYSTYSLTTVEDEASYKDVITKGLTQTAKDENNRDTNIGAGLKAGLALFEDQDAQRERIIIILSDGINENLAGSAAYKKNADKETADQVAIIRELGYPIYCAFIEKEYGDQEYLRKLVNYFDSGNENDSRLVTVSNEKINMLADSMAGIFYDLNGGMKYKKISLDSNGSYTFYMPDLDITKLQIYLNNSSDISASLQDEKGSELTGWTEGSSYFYTIEEPASGQYKLSVDSSTEVTGTIAYYTDICLKSELKGDVVRGKQISCGTDFYDSDENPVELQADAVVTADFTVTDTKTGDVLQQVNDIALTVSGNHAESKGFELQAVGDVHVKVNIAYDEFISLDYTCLEGKTLKLMAPETLKEYAGSLFSIIPAYPSDGNLQVTLKLSDYVNDADNDLTELSVLKTVLTNPENEVEAVLEDGSLKLIAKDSGLAPAYVEGYVVITDPDGLTTELPFSGNVVNVTLLIIAALVVLALLFLGGYFTYYTGRSKKSLVKTFSGYMESFEKAQAQAVSNVEKCNELTKELKTEEYENAAYTVFEFVHDNNLSKEVVKILGLDISEEEKKFEQLSAKLKALLDHAGEVVEFAETEKRDFANYKEMPVKTLESVMKHIKTSVQTLLRENDDTAKTFEEIKKLSASISECSEKIQEKVEFVEYAKGKTFDRSIYLGVKSRKAEILQNPRTWYRMLDDARITNTEEGETISEYFGVRTGILFISYDRKDEKTGKTMKGVIAVSEKPFVYRDSADAEEQAKTDTSAMIPCGADYRIENDKVGTIFVRVE